MSDASADGVPCSLLPVTGNIHSRSRAARRGVDVQGHFACSGAILIEPDGGPERAREPSPKSKMPVLSRYASVAAPDFYPSASAADTVNARAMAVRYTLNRKSMMSPSHTT